MIEMAGLLTAEQMLYKIENKNYYITKYYMGLNDEGDEVYEYELSHDTRKGYSSGVKISKQRAEEWLALGAELLEM